MSVEITGEMYLASLAGAIEHYEKIVAGLKEPTIDELRSHALQAARGAALSSSILRWAANKLAAGDFGSDGTQNGEILQYGLDHNDKTVVDVIMTAARRRAEKGKDTKIDDLAGFAFMNFRLQTFPFL